ncbi:fibronectin type III domain-containing protein [Microbacterium halotolerans]|uniref:fibronectin type III domain-containing protein n=1 Tax=Microbacterium halotolerans TaxID=246613 RepID=UPI000E6ABE59|nr:fibronectin type III domain-containing protein [Microbacterium halotolerans]
MVTITVNKSSPYVTFRMEATVVGSSSGSGYTRVRCYLEAEYSGSSNFYGSGRQIGSMDGEGTFHTVSRDPFLPQGGGGWRGGPYDILVYHRAATRRTIRMRLDYGSIDTQHTASLYLPRIPYPAPGTPNPSISSPSTGTVRLSWAKPSGYVTGYQIQREGGGIASTSSGSWSGSYTPGSTYRFRVRARNGDATGDWSSWRTVTTKAAAPSAPTSVVVSSPSAGQALIAWAPPSSDGGKPITGYQVNAYDNGGTSGWVSPSDRDYVSTRSPGAENRYRVRARNEDEIGPWSSWRSVTMQAEAPTSPRSLSATSPAPGELRATWLAPSSDGGKPIIGYDVENAADEAFTTDLFLYEDVSSPLLRDSSNGAPHGADRWVRVRARNEDQAGPWSVHVEVQILAGGWASDGDSWHSAPAHASDGSGWQIAVPYVPDGSGGWTVTR